ncbi:glycoside hydrolase family 3 protein, partial [Pseudomonas sp. BGM005]|nr:glycoside hydrolase family 3 protein [Pseudomonas sp. BG5]
MALVVFSVALVPAAVAAGTGLSRATTGGSLERASAPATGPSDRAAETVADMTTAEQAASVVMGHISTTDPSALRAYMAQGLGGFILMGGNIPATGAESKTITAALAPDSDLPPLIAIDQEGGIVSRLSGDAYPSS